MVWMDCKIFFFFFSACCFIPSNFGLLAFAKSLVSKLLFENPEYPKALRFLYAPASIRIDL